MNRQELSEYFKAKGFDPAEMFRQMRIAEINEQKEKQSEAKND
jgi:hypothetical protein